MDLRKLKTLVDLVSESNISELEITEADGKVRIVKADPGLVRPAAGWIPSPMMAAPMMAPPMAAAVPIAGAAPAANAAPVEPPETGHVIRSPMVGTFYRSSSPGGKPLVELGQAVKEGDPICIIEAMKIMNEIESEYTGVVKEILAQDAQPVEYGQVLFRIDPNA